MRGPSLIFSLLGIATLVHGAAKIADDPANSAPGTGPTQNVVGGLHRMRAPGPPASNAPSEGNMQVISHGGFTSPGASPTVTKMLPMASASVPSASGANHSPPTHTNPGKPQGERKPPPPVGRVSNPVPEPKEEKPRIIQKEIILFPGSGTLGNAGIAPRAAGGEFDWAKMLGSVTDDDETMVEDSEEETSYDSTMDDVDAEAEKALEDAGKEEVKIRKRKQKKAGGRHGLKSKGAKSAGQKKHKPLPVNKEDDYEVEAEEEEYVETTVAKKRTGKHKGKKDSEEPEEPETTTTSAPTTAPTAAPQPPAQPAMPLPYPSPYPQPVYIIQQPAQQQVKIPEVAMENEGGDFARNYRGLAGLAYQQPGMGKPLSFPSATNFAGHRLATPMQLQGRPAPASEQGSSFGGSGSSGSFQGSAPSYQVPSSGGSYPQEVQPGMSPMSPVYSGRNPSGMYVNPHVNGNPTGFQGQMPAGHMEEYGGSYNDRQPMNQGTEGMHGGAGQYGGNYGANGGFEQQRYSDGGYDNNGGDRFGSGYAGGNYGGGFGAPGFAPEGMAPTYGFNADGY